MPGHAHVAVILIGTEAVDTLALNSTRHSGSSVSDPGGVLSVPRQEPAGERAV
ncbi:hypothetical protein DSECCO2_377180 [anaerobic digester metagenome]